MLVVGVEVEVSVDANEEEEESLLLLENVGMVDDANVKEWTLVTVIIVDERRRTIRREILDFVGTSERLLGR